MLTVTRTLETPVAPSPAVNEVQLRREHTVVSFTVGLLCVVTTLRGPEEVDTEGGLAPVSDDTGDIKVDGIPTEVSGGPTPSSTQNVTTVR